MSVSPGLPWPVVCGVVLGDVVLVAYPVRWWRFLVVASRFLVVARLFLVIARLCVYRVNADIALWSGF